MPSYNSVGGLENGGRGQTFLHSPADVVQPQMERVIHHQKFDVVRVAAGSLIPDRDLKSRKRRGGQYETINAYAPPRMFFRSTTNARIEGAAATCDQRNDRAPAYCKTRRAEKPAGPSNGMGDPKNGYK